MSVLYRLLIIRPLRRVYEHGPELKGFGFWGGKSPAQICATVTAHSELFWIQHHAECETIIDQKFYSLQVTIEACVYFFCMFCIARLLYILILLRLQSCIYPNQQLKLK